MFGKASVEGAGMPAAYPRLEVGRCGDGRSVAWFALRDFGRRVEWGQLERGGGRGPIHDRPYAFEPGWGG